LHYSGQRSTRPMKDRLRESVFNLIGPAVRGKYAVDLFAGTGALGLEAVSRGAVGATFIEQHRPTVAALRRSVVELDVESACQIVTGDVFLWLRSGPELPQSPWLVFCSPPYDFYVERADQMQRLLEGLLTEAPHESVFAVEADKRFDFASLPEADAWDVRVYPPAVVGIYRKVP
jgi:16S rRNA (guanine966-N2)-methyltransferase